VCIWLEVLTRSPVVLIQWIDLRHLGALEFRKPCRLLFVPMWYQAGNLSFMCSGMVRAEKDTL